MSDEKATFTKADLDAARDAERERIARRMQDDLDDLFTNLMSVSPDKLMGVQAKVGLLQSLIKFVRG